MLTIDLRASRLPREGVNVLPRNPTDRTKTGPDHRVIAPISAMIDHLAILSRAGGPRRAPQGRNGNCEPYSARDRGFDLARTTPDPSTAEGTLLAQTSSQAGCATRCGRGARARTHSARARPKPPQCHPRRSRARHAGHDPQVQTEEVQDSLKARRRTGRLKPVCGGRSDENWPRPRKAQHHVARQLTRTKRRGDDRSSARYSCG